MTEDARTNDELVQAIRQESLLTDLSEPQQAKLAQLIELVMDGQQSLNLTAIRDPLAMVRYHLADSLALLDAMQQTAPDVTIESGADIGTGGGFPLLPMAIVRPDIQWTGIESVQKKAAFVESAASAMKLTNVTMLAERAEDVGRSELREAADLVTARAVGPVASLLEVGIPLLKTGGQIHLFKTKAAQPEWDATREILSLLGAHPVNSYEYSLPGDDQPRVIFIAEKVSDTPEKYPRRAGVPFKKPLA